MSIAFEKWHGLGNDFVVVRLGDLDQLSNSGKLADSALLARWCDRHRGIGADGVLVLSQESPDAFTMKVINADGSIPEICGNGIRCAVRSWARRHGVGGGQTVVVTTGAGPKRCRLAPDGRVEVEMGPAVFASADLPDSAAAPPRLGLVSAPLGGAERDGIPVSMGNPHWVFFDASEGGLSAEDGSRLEHDVRFRHRTNVELATVVAPDQIDVIVWERGVGFTEACGSGACATAVAAVASGRAPAGRALGIRLAGGVLTIKVSRDFQSVVMSGPAERVFEGVVEGV